MRIGEEFKKAVKRKGLSFLLLRRCSLCNYPISYLFEDDKIYLDSGCDCIGFNKVTETTWNALACYYNRQKNEEYIKSLNEYSV